MLVYDPYTLEQRLINSVDDPGPYIRCVVCNNLLTQGNGSYQKKFCGLECRKIASKFYGRSNVKEPIQYKRQNKDGYVYIKDLEGKWIAEHRYIMEQKIGRKLINGESVHHINGIRDDNRPENLELWVGAIRHGQRASDIKCHNCGTSYWPASLESL